MRAALEIEYIVGEESIFKIALDEEGLGISMYRVFIKYCVFFQEFSKVYHLSFASTQLLVVVPKITNQ